KKTSSLNHLFKELKKQKQHDIQYFSTIKDTGFLKKNTPELMKKWNLRGLFSIDDFRKEAYL
ncbi:MAG: hypothetical protein KKE20_03655, partial [Nanoarchaeota archaeon]|nr:hypothetical protein [Nanoarchaeota archaeon]